MATEGENIVMLLKIAACAVELDDLERRRTFDTQALSQSYQSWKRALGIRDRVARNSAEWARLERETAGEYGVLQDTKRQVANARKRLKTAVNKWRQFGTPPVRAKEGAQ